MPYNNQQSVATLIYCGVCELIPGPLEKSVIHMVLMAVTSPPPMLCEAEQNLVTHLFIPEEASEYRETCI
jgi:hypothetical protein